MYRYRQRGVWLDDKFENVMKRMHHDHVRQKNRLARAEKRAIKLIRMSRKRITLNSTQLQHVERYMNRRKKIEEAINNVEAQKQ